ncbi:MAG: tetratricopeptide repeat protein [Candidatus Thorarchaeota archaeon]|nr:tetratricopeptide repeat protein [Candidatus Thorarchaeota archaeon]
MRSLGTITLFFPYIDDETRKILHNTMIEASDFSDFSERLCTIVLTTNTPILTQYLNFYFVVILAEQKLLTKIATADKIPRMMKPIFLLMRYLSEDVTASWDEMTQLLADAVEEVPNEWFVCHLYLFWRYLAAESSMYPPSDYNLHPYESVVADVQKNQDLEYLRIFLLLIESRGFTSEYEVSKAIGSMEKALELAKKYDDQLMEAHIEYIMASWIKFTDTKRAIDYGIHARKIFQGLGATNGLSLIQSLLGHIMGMRGEYDAAIEHHKQAREIAGSMLVQTITADNIIAMYFLLSGKGNDALEIVNRILESSEIPPTFIPDFERLKAWALTILGRNEEARVEFDKFRELAMKSGETKLLIQMELLEGLLEKSENNIETAASTFEKILTSFRDNPMPLYENMSLINLVDIEIEMLYPESIDIRADSSGTWMNALEDHLSKFDFPGIAAQSKLLKAKFRQKQGRQDDVQRLLDEVIAASASPSMRYLKNLIAKEFPEYILS